MKETEYPLNYQFFSPDKYRTGMLNWPKHPFHGESLRIVGETTHFIDFHGSPIGGNKWLIETNGGGIMALGKKWFKNC